MIPPASCADLIPAGHKLAIPAANVPVPSVVPYGAPLTPEVEALIVAPWAAAYVITSGALEKANGRTADTIQIVESCERRVNEARPENR